MIFLDFFSDVLKKWWVFYLFLATTIARHFVPFSFSTLFSLHGLISVVINVVNIGTMFWIAIRYSDWR
jgi:hypothetical protein